MKKNKKNIFISGAAGMIGSNLIKKLVHKNNIFAFDNFSLGTSKNLEEFKKKKFFF